MNPWGFVVIAVGILLMIIGVKGTQHGVTSALTNKDTGSSVDTTSAITYSPTETEQPSTGTSQSSDTNTNSGNGSGVVAV
jgi:hypothetical protein